jgi:hypothetical protein
MKKWGVGVRWGKGFELFNRGTQYPHHFALRLDETISRVPSMRMDCALWYSISWPNFGPINLFLTHRFRLSAFFIFYSPLFLLGFLFSAYLC